METPLRRIPERLPVVRRFPARRPHTLMMLPRLCLLVSMVLGVAIWVFGEALGRILTGQGTDPNSGLLWVLIACCVWQIIPRATVSERSIAEPTVRCPSGLRDSTWRSRCGPAGIGLDSGGQGLRQRRSGTSLISFARSCTAGHGYLSRRRGGCSGVYRARGLGSARRRRPVANHTVSGVRGAGLVEYGARCRGHLPFASAARTTTLARATCSGRRQVAPASQMSRSLERESPLQMR